jgi:hypothetical protein
MTTIPIIVCGDIWCNSNEVKAQLKCAADPTQKIVLDFRAEGPALDATGIRQLILDHCQLTGRDPSTVFINNYPSLSDISPFTETKKFERSHFFDNSSKYWIRDLTPTTSEYLFGFFIGRRTISRSAMMYYLWHECPDEILFSRMPTRAPPLWVQSRDEWISLEKIEQWIVDDPERFNSWWMDPPIPSVDGYCVQDQYAEGAYDSQRVNRSLLQHYHRFNVEIVAETYTVGDTFFPTEKTVRSLMAAKPMIIYGPRNFLKNLRNMGFDTWNDTWDESYDEFEGPHRWEKIKELIDKLIKLSTEDRKQLLAQCRDVCDHNRQHLQKMVISWNVHGDTTNF